MVAFDRTLNLHSRTHSQSKVLAKSGVTVRGISRKGTPKPEATFSDYLSADPCAPNEEVGQSYLCQFIHLKSISAVAAHGHGNGCQC